MSKKSRKAKQEGTPVAAEVQSSFTTRHPHFLGLAGLTFAVLVFYWVPLTSSQASIHWDAVDVHYSTLKYFADSIREGHLPTWTPYIYSGFPFLSDTQTGVWYPLNWPVILLGAPPRAIQASLAVHCLLAAWGAYLLAFRLLAHRAASALAAVLYAFSGFFASHSSHLGMFQTAALLPWLLFALSRAFDTRRPGWVAGSGALAGIMILAGHFQTALYSCLAAGLFTIAWVIRDRSALRVAAVCLALAFGAGAMLASVQVIPGYELVRHSIRSRLFYSGGTNAPLVPSTLSTLVYANSLGAVSGKYEGPEDITQFYFYAGLVLLPLALVGLRNPSTRLPALLLILPPIWYALGPAAGFYSVLAQLPGFANVRAPVHIWFVPALALALLAAAGLLQLSQKFRAGSVVWIILAFSFADVFYWNSLSNPLAYEHMSFDERYGNGLRLYQEQVASRVPEQMRLHLPFASPTFGPLNHPLQAKAETTYGYNPLELAAYQDYMAMTEANPRLLDTLSVRFRGFKGRDGIHDNPTALPRATFPKRVIAVRDLEAAKQETSRLDPSQAAVMVASSAPAQDPAATASMAEYGKTAFRVRYKSNSPGLLRFGLPYFPGWKASVDGKEEPVVPVDYALSGVLVPAGEHDVRMEFHTPGLMLGAVLSVVAALACAGVAVWDLRRAREASAV